MFTKRKCAVGFGGIILLVYFIEYVSLIQLIQLVLLGTVLIGIYVCTPWITQTSQMALLEITQILEKAAQMDTTIKVQIGSSITGLCLLYMTELPFAQWFILVLFETAAFTVCYGCRTDADTNIKSLVDNIFKMEIMRTVAVGIGIASLTVFCTANLTCNQRITIVLNAVVYDRIFCFLVGNRYFNNMIKMVMDYTLMLDTVATVSVGMVFVSLSFYLDDVLISQWNMWNLLMMLVLALAGVCCRFAFDGDVKKMTAVVVDNFAKLDTSIKASVVMALASTFLFYIQYLSFIQWLSTLLIEISFVHIFFKVVSTGNTLEDMLVIAVENIEKMNRTRKVSLAIHVCSLSILCTMHVSVIQMTTMVLVSVSLVRISYFISWDGKLHIIIKREINNLSSMDKKTRSSVGVGFISLIILYLIELSYILLISTFMAVYILRRTVSNINGDEWSFLNWITCSVTKDKEQEDMADIDFYVKHPGTSDLDPDKISLPNVSQTQSQSKNVDVKDIFRNTSEEEAYISMEQICEMFRWKIVKFGNEFVRTEAKSMLMNIQKEEEIKEKVASILERAKYKINGLVEEHRKQLESIVPQKSLGDNMMNRIKVQSEKSIGQIKKDIEKLIEEMRLQRAKLTDNIKQEEEINKYEDVIDKSNIPTAVGLFREAIIRTVVEHVNELLPLDVEEQVRNVYLHSKLGLIKDIMLHLAKAENFDDYMQYVTKPKEFAKSYVMKLFEGNKKDINRFHQLASTRIRGIFVQLSTILSVTMSGDSRIDNIGVWIDNFVVHVSEANILPISNDKLIHLRKREEFDLIMFRQMVNEELVDIEHETAGHFTQQDDTLIKRIDETVSKLIEKLWGCPEICMFCKEPCKYTVKDHKVLHQCIQHRPQGIGGMHKHKTKNLVVDCCNESVTSAKVYKRPNDNEYLQYKSYKKDYPDWGIESSSGSSEYWKWVMFKYKEEITDYHKVQPPNIPASWHTITKEQAIESIK